MSKRIRKWSHSVLNHILLYNLLRAHQQMRWQVFLYALLCPQHIILQAVWEMRMNFSSSVEDTGPTLQPQIYCTVLFTSSNFSHAGFLPQGDSGSFSKPWRLCSIFMISAFSSLCRCFLALCLIRRNGLTWWISFSKNTVVIAIVLFCIIIGSICGFFLLCLSSV